jgi:type IV pilus assembly protein PilF
MRRSGSFAVLVMAMGMILAACSTTTTHNNDNLGQKATPQKQAATNVQLAIEFMKLNKMAESRDTIERAMKEDPGSADVQLTAGIIYERLNNLKAATKAYSTAARLGKNDPNVQNTYAGFLCRTGKAAAGEKLFIEVSQNGVYTTPEVALVNAGVCVSSIGDLVDAERYFNRALAVRPNMPEAMVQLGNVALDRGDAAQAVEVVQRYLAVNQATAEILWLGVRAERKLGDNTSAAAFARRIQAEFPDSQQAQTMRSGVDR